MRIFGLGPMELAVIGIVAVLLFGRKLPELSRYLAKAIHEFRNGFKGLETDFDAPSARNVTPEPVRPPQRVVVTAPKFEDTPAPSNAVQA